MECTEINSYKPLKIPHKISEENLILMFPYTYRVYSVMIAYRDDSFQEFYLNQGAQGLNAPN